MKNLLVPISFSEASEKSLQQAVSIARQYGAALNLLHCYPAREYNRKYDFGKENYESGIRRMLKEFYEKHIDNTSGVTYDISTCEGPVSEIISEISPKYDLLVLSRKTGFQSKKNKWFSDKIFHFVTRARCPVLLLPVNTPGFSFNQLETIWHIKRQKNETELINFELARLGIPAEKVTPKSLEQKIFFSAFWQNIVAYTQKHDDAILKKISASYGKDHIDLLVLVNQRKSLFEAFLKEDAFQIISQFDIPILIV